MSGPEVHEKLRTLNKCPLQQARWCIISDYEMAKCENMIMAFAAKNLKPDLNCIRGESVQDCMYKIKFGDADLITLDAADVYSAGRFVMLFFSSCLQCFDAVGWAAGRASGL